MVFNSRLARRIITALFLFSILPVLYAQEGDFYIDTSGVRPRFFQRLSWSGDEYALFYEVVIEKEGGNGEYTEVLRENTKERSISVSLAAGNYRYIVLPINLLGQQSEDSGWRMFKVMSAYMPYIEKFYPAVFFLDRYFKRELDIAGDNMLEESEIYLRKTTGFNIYPINKIIYNKEHAKLFFDDLGLVSGQYEIYIKNPGGLETSAGDFSISYRKPLDLLLKTFWIPVIPAYGEMQEVLGTEMYMAGAGLSFEAISSGRSSVNAGLELAVSAFALNPVLSFDNGIDGFFSSLADTENGASFAEFDLNFAFQKQFMLKRMSVTARFGVGVTMMNSSSIDSFLIHINFGLSYLFIIHEIFFIDAGATLTHYFGDESSGLIKPRLGIGWLF